VIQAAASLAANDHELGELLAVMLLMGPLALASALGGGYLLARKALAPVERIAATADEMTAVRLHQRLAVANPDDELGRLAQTLNGMIARLERSFEEIRRFTADAAHELRTPLSVLRNEAEVALRNPRDPEHYRQVLEGQIDEVARLSRLVEQLLFLCREDSGSARVEHQAICWDRVIHGVADHMHVVAEEKGVTLDVADLAPCRVQGDEDHLRRLLFNLLDNAIKYTPAGGRVTVRTECLNGRASLRVSDTGVGISPEHLPRVFDRFYRVDPARGRETGGLGLGLAISRAIAESHGGTLEIESTLGQGTRLTLTLPSLR
jgi:heavy metal sensor kinase